MKIEVGKTYIDGVGCTVLIVHKMENPDAPFIGVVSWKTARDKRCRDESDEVQEYKENGHTTYADCRTFDLKRERPEKIINQKEK